MRTKLALPAVMGAWLLVCPAVAFAQQTGTVSGGVFDKSGSPVTGATVRVSGDPMPVPRTTLTTDTGAYAFTQLLPGNYSVEVEKTGVGKMKRAVEVGVGRDTQTDFILGSQLSEEIVVNAATPEVDLRSTEVSFNFKRDFIQDLPLDRSYMGLLQLVPGVAENGTFAPNAGGSRQDNTYLIDGVNITNPLFGYLSTEINELDITEINAKRGAITAEFGRTQGMVSNAVTRSGTNRLSGSYRFEAIPNEWIAASDKAVRSATDRWVNAFGAGGPIVKDRAFFYASGRIFRSTANRANNLFGPLPPRSERTNEYFGKVTAPIGSMSFLNVGYRHRPTTIENASIGASDSPAVGTNSEGTNRVLSASYDWFVTSRMTASIKYVHFDEENEAVAITDLGFQPAFDPNNLASMGRVVVGGVAIGGASLRLNQQNYSRSEIKGSLSQFFDFAGMTHQIRAGFGWDQGTEDLTRKSNGWGDISNVTGGGLPPRTRTTYYPEQPTQYSKGRSYSFFVQDDLQMRSRLALNLGLLLTRDEFIQDLRNLTPPTGSTTFQTGTFLTFGFFDEIQPRLGVNYQLRKGQGDKVYANWGRFYGLDQKSSSRALASGRLYTENSDFDILSGALLFRAPQANTVAKNIVAGIKSPYMDEVVVGYATPLADGWSLDAFFMFRNSNDFIEDVPTVLPASTFQYQNDPAAERRYKTVAVELNRVMRDHWAMNVSYAWSKLYGNYDIDYSTTQIFNTSSLLDDGPGAFLADTFRQGVLSQDRSHVFKVLATWVPPRVPHLNIGMYLRTQSGTPWEARGLSWASGTTYIRFLEPAGSHRNPLWTNADIQLSYGVPLGGRRSVRLEGRILNLFNQETVLSVDQRKYLDGRNNTAPNPAPPADCLSCWTDAYAAIQPTNLPNGNFGTATSYAAPRRFLLSVLLNF